MKMVLPIVIWAALALLFAPKFVKITRGGRESNNIFIKWLILFLLPIVIVLILSMAGLVIVGSMSLIGLILLLIPLIVIVAYFTVGININGRKYKFFR